jgi:hypothetical protein
MNAATGSKPNKGQVVKLDGTCYERVNDNPVAKGTQGSIFDGAIGGEISDNCVACDDGAAAANTYAALFATNTGFDNSLDVTAVWPSKFSSDPDILPDLMSSDDQLPSGVGGTFGYDLEKGVLNTGKLSDLYLKIFEFAESKSSVEGERSIDPAATVINPDADSFKIDYITANDPFVMSLNTGNGDLAQWYWTLNNDQTPAWDTDDTHADALQDASGDQWFLYSIFPKDMFDRFKIGGGNTSSVITHSLYSSGDAADVNMATGAIDGYKVSVLGLGAVTEAEHSLTGGHGTGGKLLVTDNSLPAGLYGGISGFLPPATNAISAGGSGYMVGDELTVDDGAKIVVTSIDEADLLYTVVKLPASAHKSTGSFDTVTIDIPA